MGCLCSLILHQVPGLQVAWTSHRMDGSTAEPLDSAHTSAFGPLVRGFSPEKMKNSRSVTEVCEERGLPGTGTSCSWPPAPAGADGALQGPTPAHQSCIDLQQYFVMASTKGSAGNPPNTAALWGLYRRGTRAWAHAGVQQGLGAWGLLLSAEHRQQQCQAPRSSAGSAVPLVNASHGHTRELHHLRLFWRQSTARSPRAVPS